jgi:hypothetical protein
VCKATEKNKVDIKEKVAEWYHRAYMHFVQCTVVHSGWLLRGSTPFVNLRTKWWPDVCKIPCTYGRVYIGLMWHHIYTGIAEHVMNTGLENQWSAVVRHPHSSCEGGHRLIKIWPHVCTSKLSP